MSGTITFGMNYDVKPEHAGAFVNTSLEAIALMNTLSGHRRTKLYRDVENEHAFLIYSEWETHADFQNFMRSDAFKQVQTLGREMLAKRPEHRIYTSQPMGGKGP